MKFLIPSAVTEYLARIDCTLKPIDEVTIGSHISELRKNADPPLSREESDGAWIELCVFHFSLSPSGEASVWGTAFGPTFSAVKSDGTEVHTPDISEMDATVVDYWKKRTAEAKHPVLRARYADIVWDLSNAIAHDKPDVSFARIAIDAYIDAVNEQLYCHEVVGINYCERALVLSISISDSQRIPLVKKMMFQLYDLIADASKKGTWPFLFDNLYDNKKTSITEPETERIIDSLENLLARYSNYNNKEEFDPFGAQEAALRLERHYRRISRQDEVERVTRTWGHAFEQIAAEASHFLAMTWLQTVFEAYLKLGLKEDAQRVQLASRAKGADSESEVRKVSVSVPITREELDGFFDAITEGDIVQTLNRIAAHFIPDLDEARKQLKHLQKSFPLVAMIPITQVSDGHIVGTVDSVDEDPDGRLVIAICQRIELSAMWLAGSFDRMKQCYTVSPEYLVDFLFQSPLFLPNRRELILCGLKAWNEGDYVKTIHVLIPQIESALRTMLGLLGLPTNRPRRGTGAVMQEKNLGELLKETCLKEKLGQNIHRYLDAFLSDHRGLNVRNLLCHGLMSADHMTQPLADRVVHVMLVLALFRRQEDVS